MSNNVVLHRLSVGGMLACLGGFEVARPHPIDVRNAKILKRADNGEPYKLIAFDFDIATRLVNKIVSDMRKTRNASNA